MKQRRNSRARRNEGNKKSVLAMSFCCDISPHCQWGRGLDLPRWNPSKQQHGGKLKNRDNFLSPKCVHRQRAYGPGTCVCRDGRYEGGCPP